VCSCRVILLYSTLFCNSAPLPRAGARAAPLPAPRRRGRASRGVVLDSTRSCIRSTSYTVRRHETLWQQRDCAGGNRRLPKASLGGARRLLGVELEVTASGGERHHRLQLFAH
jgi:hypothetical protein